MKLLLKALGLTVYFTSFVVFFILIFAIPHWWPIIAFGALLLSRIVYWVYEDLKKKEQKKEKDELLSRT